MIELRGISINNSSGQKRILLHTRLTSQPYAYQSFEFPSLLPLNRGQIIKFIADHFGIPPGQITWPPHVKIPGEE